MCANFSLDQADDFIDERNRDFSSIDQLAEYEDRGTVVYRVLGRAWTLHVG